MNKILLILSLCFVLCFVFVAATFYPEPWGNNQDANDQNLTNVDYVFVEHIDISDTGYIYDNGTTLIIGRS